MLRNSCLENKGVKRHYDTDEEMVDLSLQTFIIPKFFDYDVARVSEGTAARPDIVSYKIYGTNMYGDLICKINGISNPFELNEGMTIVIPKIEYINDFFMKETQADEDAQGSNKPTPKRKNEKRKAADATTGDIRFRIDNDRKLIIY